MARTSTPPSAPTTLKALAERVAALEAALAARAAEDAAWRGQHADQHDAAHVGQATRHAEAAQAADEAAAAFAHELGALRPLVEAAHAAVTELAAARATQDAWVAAHEATHLEGDEALQSAAATATAADEALAAAVSRVEGDAAAQLGAAVGGVHERLEEGRQELAAALAAHDAAGHTPYPLPFVLHRLAAEWLDDGVVRTGRAADDGSTSGVYEGRVACPPGSNAPGADGHDWVPALARWTGGELEVLDVCAMAKDGGCQAVRTRRWRPVAATEHDATDAPVDAPTGTGADAPGADAPGDGGEERRPLD